MSALPPNTLPADPNEKIIRHAIFQALLFFSAIFFGYIPILIPSVAVSLGWMLGSICLSIGLIWIGFDVKFYYERRLWFIPLGSVLGVGLATYFAVNSFQDTACFAFQEENGRLVLEAEDYKQTVPGRPSSIESQNPARDASAYSWYEHQDFSGVLKALPDTHPTNTLTDTNGPALLYPINFTNPGIYYVYIKGFGADTNGDSIHVGLSGFSVVSSNKNGFSLSSNIQKPHWTAKPDEQNSVVINVPMPGIYTFYVWMRENGVSIDKIWLDKGQGSIDNGSISDGPPASRCN